MLWHRNTLTVLRRTLDNPRYADEFASIVFRASGTSITRRNTYVRGLNRASAMLHSMVEEIESYGEEEISRLDEGNRPMTNSPTAMEKVFVVHGRNHKSRDALFTFLRSIGLHPLEWNEAVRATGKASPYIGEILDAAFSQAGAVVVLMTPDDEARLREPFVSANDPPHETELTGQARPNVIFEAGMAMGRDADRTVLIELGSLRPFSDIGGRHVIRLDDRTQRRQELAQRLQSAGCPVNLDGTDWHTAGDFDAALSET